MTLVVSLVVLVYRLSKPITTAILMFGTTELSAFNPFVVGSIPAQPTRICNRNNGLQEIVAFFFVQNSTTHPLHTVAGF